MVTFKKIQLPLLAALTATAMPLANAFTTSSPSFHAPSYAKANKSSQKIKKLQHGYSNPLEKSHDARLASNSAVFGTIEWSDLLYDDTSTAFDAWEWTNG